MAANRPDDRLIEDSSGFHHPPHVLRVLVADPGHDTRARYREVLHGIGCEVVEAADGREALVEALVRRPSLILMESRLPLLNGPALCEILRRDSTTRTVPILAVADHATAREAERIRRAGADLVVIKPVEPVTLVTELRRLTHTSDPDPAPRAAVESGRWREAAPGDVRPKHLARSRTHPRFTTTAPPEPPPILMCPSCDGSLVYERSHIGGVSSRHLEQWDEYICPACGAFEYRHRTRKLRRQHRPD